MSQAHNMYALPARGQTKSPTEENYGRIGDIHLTQVPKAEDCNPGLDPVEYNLIIAPAIIPDKIGNIVLADETKESKGMAAQVGRIVACSPLAFNYDKWPSLESKPRRGDIVWFARYAGGLFEGADGREYRIIKDKDVGAVIRVEPKSSESEAA